MKILAQILNKITQNNCGHKLYYYLVTIIPVAYCSISVYTLMSCTYIDFYYRQGIASCLALKWACKLFEWLQVCFFLYPYSIFCGLDYHDLQFYHCFNFELSSALLQAIVQGILWLNVHWFLQQLWTTM